MAASRPRWYRGNLHTHTTNSDGDSDPDVVVAWYRDAGYDFLALTDHDLLTLPSDHAGSAGAMVLIPGEEVSAGHLHVNALGITATIPPVVAPTVADTLQANVDAVVAAGGVASVNHPNYHWLVQPADLAGLRGCGLFEVHNAGPETNDAGGEGHASTEALWDVVLGAGLRMRGIAVDDAHHFKVFGHRYSNPGRAWVHVRAERLDVASVLTAVTEGELYASTGVELEDLRVTGGELAISVAAQFDRAYRTSFIGPGGRILEVVEGQEARFRARSGLPYVRARVDDSDGFTAWTQPLFGA